MKGDSFDFYLFLLGIKFKDVFFVGFVVFFCCFWGDGGFFVEGYSWVVLRGGCE